MKVPVARLAEAVAMDPPTPARAKIATSAPRYQFDVRTLTRHAKNSCTAPQMMPVKAGSVTNTVDS